LLQPMSRLLARTIRRRWTRGAWVAATMLLGACGCDADTRDPWPLRVSVLADDGADLTFSAQVHVLTRIRGTVVAWESRTQFPPGSIDNPSGPATWAFSVDEGTYTILAQAPGFELVVREVNLTADRCGHVAIKRVILTTTPQDPPA
jgi:hypothetical protein